MLLGGNGMIYKIKIILFLLLVSVFIPNATTPITKVTFLFSHGIAATKRQAYTYAQITPSVSYNDRYLINNQHHVMACFNFPDAGESYRINRRETSLAQANEVKALHDAHIDIHPETGVVGIGVSRGASAFITWLGTHPDESKIQNLRGLILESPFDSIDSVLRYIIGEKLYQHPGIRSFSHGLVKFIFSKYDRTFITPLEAAAKVPLTIPILIVCSEEDTRVPAALSKKLYEELIKTGHDKAHFICLKHGAHGKLIQGPDSTFYRNIVHAFYAKYELPHNAEYAELGKEAFERSQPAV